MVKRGAFSLFKGSKRGLSPLIATVLLIAFAVSMGAMIMNWSSTLGQEPSGPDCSGVKLIMNPIVCYSENFIKVNLKNEGDQIDSLTVIIADDNAENEVVLKNSALRRGEELFREIPYAKAGSTYIGIVPSIRSEDKLTDCDVPALEILNLEECPAAVG